MQEEGGQQEGAQSSRDRSEGKDLYYNGTHPLFEREGHHRALVV